jgi:periplasmic protein TonB
LLCEKPPVDLSAALSNERASKAASLPGRLPDTSSTPLPPWARHGLIAGVFAAHLGAAWGLMQIAGVREAVAEVAPMVVDFIAAPTPPAPPPPPPPPPKIPPRVLPPPPAPVIAAAPSTEPAPAAMTAPPPPAEPPALPAAAEPAAPPAPPPPPAPRTIPATAVSYLEPPAPVYPMASRRLGEQGEVLLKVEIGTDGRARQVLVSRSSGSPRLDNAASAAVRAARFRPYTENGVPLVVWTTVPIQFELENK